MKKLQYSVYILLFLSLTICLLYVAREFLIPLVSAGLFAMLFIRFCNKIEKHNINRAVSSLIAVMLLLISIAIVISLLIWQLNDFAKNVGDMEKKVLSLFQDLKEWIDKRVGISEKQQEIIIGNQEKNTSNESGNMLTSFISGTVGMFINTILGIVYLYLLLYFRSRIKSFILKLVPIGSEEKAKNIIRQSTEISQKYLSGLSLMIVILWVMYGVGFTLVGVENALFFAILCGILEIVPFVGNITGTSITAFAVLTQGGQSDQIIAVIIVYLFVQFIQTYLLEPLVVGSQVSLNPLFTIMILVVGQLIWGIAGMILAIPLLGIVKIICDNIPELRPYGYLIGRDKKRKVHVKFRKK